MEKIEKKLFIISLFINLIINLINYLRTFLDKYYNQYIILDYNLLEKY